MEFVPPVEQMPGEPLVFWVRSASNPGARHRVELDSYDTNGSCTCIRFAIKCAPKLEKGIKGGTAATRCSHIEIAYREFGKLMVRKIVEHQAEARRRREHGCKE